LNENVLEVSIDDCFVGGSFREGRDVNGTLNFLPVSEALIPIFELPMMDVINQRQIKIKDLNV
jgi:hypothetical protein